MFKLSENILEMERWKEGKIFPSLRDLECKHAENCYNDYRVDNDFVLFHHCIAIPHRNFMSKQIQFIQTDHREECLSKA